MKNLIHVADKTISLIEKITKKMTEHSDIKEMIRQMNKKEKCNPNRKNSGTYSC